MIQVLLQFRPLVKKITKKTIALISIASLMLSIMPVQGIQAIEAIPGSVGISEQLPGSSVIPLSGGKITDARYFDSAKTVINIQDLHCHPGVQRNINSLLSKLDETYHLKKVYVEGGIGSIDTSWVNIIGNPSLRQRIIESLMDTGKLTGSEYFSITRQRPELLEGIEDKNTYVPNLLRLGEIITKRDEITAFMPAAKADIKALKSRYYSSANQQLDECIERYTHKTITAGSYYKQLFHCAAKGHIALNNYQNMATFISLEKMQNRLHTKQIKVQMQKCIAALKENLTFGKYKALIEMSSDPLRRDELCDYLSSIVRDNSLPTGDYRALVSFLNYHESNKRLNTAIVIQEEKNLVRELHDRLSESDGEREVAFLADFIGYLDQYCGNRMSADDYAYYVRHIPSFRHLWVKYIHEGIPSSFDSFHTLIDKFYAVNVERNAQFVRTMLGDMPDPQNHETPVLQEDILCQAAKSLSGTHDIIVIVTGGFHTSGLAEILKKRKISYVVITPDIPNGTGFADSAYNEIAQQQAKVFTSQTIALNLLSQQLAKETPDEELVGLYTQWLSAELTRLTAQGYTSSRIVEEINKTLSTDKNVSLSTMKKLASAAVPGAKAADDIRQFFKTGTINGSLTLQNDTFVYRSDGLVLRFIVRHGQVVIEESGKIAAHDSSLRVVVIGATGFLGRKIYSTFKLAYPNTIGTEAVNSSGHSERLDHNEVPEIIQLDLRDENDIARFMEKYRPDVIIYAAGGSKNDFSSKNPQESMQMNQYAIRRLGKHFSKGRFIYISSPNVFKGDAKVEYQEQSKRYPDSTYGVVKMSAEDEVKESFGERGFVVRPGMRVGYNTPEDGYNFLKDVVQHIESAERGDARDMRVNDNRLYFPTWIDDIARSLLSIVHNGLTGVPGKDELEGIGGIFHITGTEGFTKFNLAKMIVREFNRTFPTKTRTPFHIYRTDRARKSETPYPLTVKMVATDVGVPMTPIAEAVRYTIFTSAADRLKGSSKAATMKIQGDDGRWYVKKTAFDEGRDKLINEIKFILNVPPEFKKWFPEIIDYDITSPEVFYIMPFYDNMKSLSQYMMDPAVSLDDVREKTRLVMDVMARISLLNSTPRSKGFHFVRDFVTAKTLQRFEQVRNTHPVFKKIIDAPTIVINGKRYENALPLLRKIMADPVLMERLEPRFFSMMHGDFNFGNIMMSADNQTIKLIDMRGSPETGDIMYDIAKLVHSTDAKYEVLCYDFFHASHKEEGGDISIDFDYQRDTQLWKTLDHLDKEFPGMFFDSYLRHYDVAKKDPHWLERAAYINAHLLLSDITFHIKNDGKDERALAIYATGVQLLNEYYDLIKGRRDEFLRFPVDRKTGDAIVPPFTGKSLLTLRDIIKKVLTVTGARALTERIMAHIFPRDQKRMFPVLQGKNYFLTSARYNDAVIDRAIKLADTGMNVMVTMPMPEGYSKNNMVDLSEATSLVAMGDSYNRVWGQEIHTEGGPVMLLLTEKVTDRAEIDARIRGVAVMQWLLANPKKVLNLSDLDATGFRVDIYTSDTPLSPAMVDENWLGKAADTLTVFREQGDSDFSVPEGLELQVADAVVSDGQRRVIDRKKVSEHFDVVLQEGERDSYDNIKTIEMALKKKSEEAYMSGGPLLSVVFNLREDLKRLRDNDYLRELKKKKVDTLVLRQVTGAGARTLRWDIIKRINKENLRAVFEYTMDRLEKGDREKAMTEIAEGMSENAGGFWLNVSKVDFTSGPAMDTLINHLQKLRAKYPRAVIGVILPEGVSLSETDARLIFDYLNVKRVALFWAGDPVPVDVSVHPWIVMNMRKTSEGVTVEKEFTGLEDYKRSIERLFKASGIVGVDAGIMDTGNSFFDNPAESFAEFLVKQLAEMRERKAQDPLYRYNIGRFRALHLAEREVPSLSVDQQEALVALLSKYLKDQSETFIKDIIKILPENHLVGLADEAADNTENTVLSNEEASGFLQGLLERFEVRDHLNQRWTFVAKEDTDTLGWSLFMARMMLHARGIKMPAEVRDMSKESGIPYYHVLSTLGNPGKNDEDLNQAKALLAEIESEKDTTTPDALSPKVREIIHLLKVVALKNDAETGPLAIAELIRLLYLYADKSTPSLIEDAGQKALEVLPEVTKSIIIAG